MFAQDTLTIPSGVFQVVHQYSQHLSIFLAPVSNSVLKCRATHHLNHLYFHHLHSPDVRCFHCRKFGPIAHNAYQG